MPNERVRMDGWIYFMLWRTAIPGDEAEDQCQLVNNRCCLWEYIFNLTPEVTDRTATQLQQEERDREGKVTDDVRSGTRWVIEWGGTPWWAISDTSQIVEYTHEQLLVMSNVSVNMHKHKALSHVQHITCAGMTCKWVHDKHVRDNENKMHVANKHTHSCYIHISFI